MNFIPNKPKLRFREFDSNWKKKSLNDIAIKSNIKNRNNKINRVLTNSATMGIVDQKDYFDKDIANQGNLQGYYIVEKNDFIYNPRISTSAPVGPISRNKLENGVMSPLYTVLKFNEGDLDYLEHYFSTNKWYTYMENIANYGARSDRMSFSMGDFLKMPIILPEIKEQQKIASFLTAVDTKIQALKKKKVLLEQYKKGVMQKIFSQKLRFKDENGKNYPKWEYIVLEKIAKRITTKNKEDNQNVLTISAQHGLISQLDFFNKSVSAKNLKNYYLLEKGDFAYNKSYSNGYPMGAIKCLRRYPKGVVSTLYICFRFNNNINIKFMEYYFDFGIQNSELAKIAQEGARNHGLLNIGLTDFFSIKIFLPRLEEQLRISECLNIIDEKLVQLNKTIVNLESWKKGLLQKLFV